MSWQTSLFYKSNSPYFLNKTGVNIKIMFSYFYFNDYTKSGCNLLYEDEYVYFINNMLFAKVKIK